MLLLVSRANVLCLQNNNYPDKGTRPAKGENFLQLAQEDGVTMSAQTLPITAQPSNPKGNLVMNPFLFQSFLYYFFSLEKINMAKESIIVCKQIQ